MTVDGLRLLDRSLGGITILLLFGVGFGLGFGLPADTEMRQPWARIAQVAGWIYFSSWSLSFYPQFYLNWRRKSVEGFSFDFAVWNVMGFCFYSIFNCAMMWSAPVRLDYRIRNHGALPAVFVNDVFFAIHAALVTSATLVQIFIYEGGSQKISTKCIISTSFAIGTASVYGLLVAAFPATFSVLDWLYFLSYIKMCVTLVKYIPQVVINYGRKSTVGWSIGQVLLDILGGVLSCAQQVMQAVVNDDFSAITGNPIKFGLGFVSVSFDLVFMVQHYLLYSGSRSGTAGWEARDALPQRYVFLSPEDLDAREQVGRLPTLNGVSREQPGSVGGLGGILGSRRLPSSAAQQAGEEKPLLRSQSVLSSGGNSVDGGPL